MSNETNQTNPSESAWELTKSVTLAAETLFLAYPEVANILEISQSRAKGLFTEEYLLDPSLDEWSRATYFVRLFRDLEAIIGTSGSGRLWLTSYNLALHDTPLNLIQSREGLVSVVQYIEKNGNW